MPVAFPLNKVPEIPPVLTSIAIDKLVSFLNKIIEKLLKLVDEATELPDDCGCDDPRVQALKDGLDEILKLLEKLQALLPKIQDYVTLFKTLISIASSIKNSLYLIPIVGQAVLASDLNVVQNLTIESAKKSLGQLESVPGRLNVGIDLAVNQLAKIASRLSTACSGAGNNGNSTGLDDDLFKVPKEIKDSLDTFNTDYNDLLPSEFYQLTNVMEDDIDLRSDLIKELIDQQRDLLSSLNDAPAVVLKGNGLPAAEIGKSGDYYVDLADNNKIYGPKTLNTWMLNTNTNTTVPSNSSRTTN